MGRKNLRSILLNKTWNAIKIAENAETAYNKFQPVVCTALDISCPQREHKNIEALAN